MTKNMGVGGRPTHHINRRVTQSAFRAFDFAASENRHLNTYAVIVLKDGQRGAAAAFRAILHKFRDWLSYKRAGAPDEALSPAYIYAIENPGDHTHVNWAVHVPDGLQAEFKKKLPRWVEKVQGELRPRDVHVQPINTRYAKRLAKYILKGTDPLYVRHFYLEEVHQPQGEVWGRRAGISLGLGIKARARAGFHPGRRHYPSPRNAFEAVQRQPQGWNAR